MGRPRSSLEKYSPEELNAVQPMRTCTDCGQTKPLADYTPIKGTPWTHTPCEPCRGARARTARPPRPSTAWNVSTSLQVGRRPSRAFRAKTNADFRSEPNGSFGGCRTPISRALSSTSTAWRHHTQSMYPELLDGDADSLQHDLRELDGIRFLEPIGLMFQDCEGVFTDMLQQRGAQRTLLRFALGG